MTNDVINPVFHDKITSLAGFHETVVAMFSQSTPVFLRTTPTMNQDLKRGFSSHRYREFDEKGISAVEFTPGQVGGVNHYIVKNRIDLAGAFLQSLSYDLEHVLHGYGPQTKTYVLTGRVIGKGSDNEPLLDASTIEIISLLDKRVKQEAELIRYAAALEDYPYRDQATIDGQKRSRGIALLMAIGEKPVPKEVLADYPDLEPKFKFEQNRAKI